VNSILKNGLDREPIAAKTSEPQQLALTHENVRGGEYYN
jgi:hypothetical protein